MEEVRFSRRKSRSMLIMVLLLLVLIGCGREKGSSNSFYEDNEDGYSDGTYCAEIEYYNPNTGTSSTYELDVEIEDNYLVQINWPNGGWLDETHFSSEEISSGSCSFTSDRGYEYTVNILSKGGGCGSGYDLQSDVNGDTEDTTCPECGSTKYSYDDYCYSCTSKKEEHTCILCGGYKASYEVFCASCDSEDYKSSSSDWIFGDDEDY